MNVNFTKSFLNEAVKYPEWFEALDFINKNSNGDTYLIGGFIYRNLAHNLYGAQKPSVDLDFIIEKPVEYFNLPSGWKIAKNRFGNIKILGPKNPIDYVPIQNIHSIQFRQLTPSIQNYLTGTPLTVQSICYDIKNQELIGEIGINSIKEKLVKINNLDEALYGSKIKGKLLNEYIKDIADNLGFRFVLHD